MNRVSIVIPSYNSESSIIPSLESLNSQNKYFSELIIVNDGSSDKSPALIKKYLSQNFKNINKKVINHSKPKGLSASYNDGILAAKGKLIITLHTDAILQKNAIPKIIKPFSSKSVIATYHQSILPLKIWQKYNFWQKCFFDRFVNKTCTGFDGKFDCFRRSSLIQVNLFDSKTFFRAGEDGDMLRKLEKIGKVVKTTAQIIHLHGTEKNFNSKKLIYKQAQYSEAYGAIFRRYGFNLKQFVSTFFREILLLSLLIPPLRYLSVCLIIAYSIFYTKNTIYYEFPNPKIITLPFLNIYLLFVSLFHSTKGFILGRETV